MKIRVHVSHVFFALALVALTALGAWWTVYIVRSVAFERDARLARLRDQVRVVAMIAGHDPHTPSPGPAVGSDGLEWVRSEECRESDICAAALPYHADFSVRPVAGTMESVNQRSLRGRVMVIGEGITLFGLLGVCTIMLYSLVRQERSNIKSMESFVSAVTHEMKTPLAGIKSLLQTLAAGRVPEDQRSRLLALGLKETDRLEHTIENVLLAGSLRTDRYQLQMEEIDLDKVLAAIVEHRRSTMAGRDDAVQLELGELPAGPALTADPRALRVILENLLDNAVKYGGGEHPIILRTRHEAHETRIEVHDRGIGFDARQTEELFAPFRRALDRGNEVQHGTGLGLNIARELARRMGGELTASSPGPGLGSTFVVVLPRAEGGQPVAKGQHGVARRVEERRA